MYDSKYEGAEVEALLDLTSKGGYPMVEHGTEDTTFTLTPNTYHVWGSVAELNLSLAETLEGVTNEYLFSFTAGGSLILPDAVTWANGAPEIEVGKTYQISILDNIGLWVKV